MSLPLFITLLALCCGYALFRGGAPEQIAAALQLTAFVAGLAAHVAIEGSEYRTASVVTAALDVILFAALTWLACRSTRWWPILIAGWQLASIFAHVARAIDPGMMRVGYAVQAQIWAYPMLLATAAGAWRHQRRLSTDGRDPAWKRAPALDGDRLDAPHPYVASEAVRTSRGTRVHGSKDPSADPGCDLAASEEQ